jgi:pimeloyl-ACP methyl ester carboxylesterase
MNSLWPDIVKDDLPALGAFEVPVVMIQGSEDLSTEAGVAKDYFDRIEAPSKHYVPLVGRGHLGFYREPKAFLKALNRYVRPLALEPQTP